MAKGSAGGRLNKKWESFKKFFGFGFTVETQWTIPWLKEFYGLMLCSMGVAVLLALLSFSKEDGLIHFNEQELHNWLGPIGSVISETLYLGIGFFALFVPVFLILEGCRLIGARKIFTMQRIVGITLINTSLILLFGHKEIGTIFFGGIIGQVFREAVLKRSSLTGILLLSSTIMLLGITILLGRPILKATVLKMPHLFKFCKEKIKFRWPKKTKVDEPKIIVSNIRETIPPGVPELLRNGLYDTDIPIIERNKVVAIDQVKKVDSEKNKKEYSFELPPLRLLDYDEPTITPVDPKTIKLQAEKLQKAFMEFNIEGKIREIRPGPVVTLFEFVPSPGIKLSKIASLSDDIAMAMSAVQVRIVTPIPGKGAVGIEVPNEKRETVFLKEIVASEKYRRQEHKLCMAVGKDVEGEPFFMNLADMPHVLIAGTTGSGKSVSVNAMICSILYRATPKDVRFLMIDPKMLELSVYSGIPHLLLPPIIDAKKAQNALKWAVKEMDSRYALMKEAHVRDITTYNEKIKSEDYSQWATINDRKHEHLPYLVIVIDEYADLLAMAGKEVEGYVMRLAQKARAAGIHVMLATQRPSVDVITGVIKANFPVRMGFRLASSHDSKTIINKTGAEKLLGRGDVLIMPPGTSDLLRVHGAFISEKELSRVVNFLAVQAAPSYQEEIAEFHEDEENGNQSFSNHGSDEDNQDEKYVLAIGIVKEHKKCSTSFIQRHLSIGYNRAARIVDQMEKKGVVGPVLNARGEREIFLSND